MALGLAIASLAPGARADESDASIRVAARELAVAGAEAYDKQDYATALDRFQRAEALYRAPSIGVMVARCLARVGRLVEAVDKYEETRRTPLDPGAPEAFRSAVADANAEIDAVNARVARLQLRLPADLPEGVAVTLDQHPVPAALIGVDMPVDPGTHRLVARARGRAPYASDLTLGEGARQEVELAFSLAEEPAPASRPPGRESEPPGASTLALAVLAGGGLAIAGGTVTGIIALNHKSTLDRSCTPGCPESLRSELSAYRLTRTLSYVGFGLGVAALGTGTYFLLHRSPSGRELRAEWSPTGGALTGTF